jgi:hypothetical protein
MTIINYSPEPPSNQLMTNGLMELDILLTDKEREAMLLDSLLSQAKAVCSLVLDSKLPITISSNHLATLAHAICDLQNKINEYESHQQQTMEM